MKIGVLEGDASTREYLTNALESEGHIVRTHTDGMSLLDVLFAEQSIKPALPYDLLIIDLSLPGTLSGLSVISYIRQTMTPEALSIILLSTASQSQLEQIHTRFPNIYILQETSTIKQLVSLIETSRADAKP